MAAILVILVFEALVFIARAGGTGGYILAIPLARLDILNILHGGLVFLAILLAKLVFVIFLLG